MIIVNLIYFLFYVACGVSIAVGVVLLISAIASVIIRNKSGNERYTFTGRQKIPLRKKLNPVWWFQNEAEQRLEDADWYMPGEPEEVRRFNWEARNPAQNLRAFVLGVQDRNYAVVGRPPVLTVQRDDLPDIVPGRPYQLGWQYCVCEVGLGLAFVSHSGERYTWYIGWQPSGFFGAKFDPRG